MCETMSSPTLRFVKKGHAPWTLSVYLPSGIYREAEDVVHVMFSGLHSSLKDIYLKSDKKNLKSRRKRVLFTYTRKLMITLS